MASEMAETAYGDFCSWIKGTYAEDTDSYSVLFHRWLREGNGMDSVARDYGLAVETLLLTLTQPPEPAREFAHPNDTSAWDFMTETGFRVEVFRRRAEE